MSDKQTAGNWRRIKEIFSAAMEKDEAGRIGYVDSVCDGDSFLRDEVLLMLSLQKETEEFIETPAFSFGEAFQNKSDNFKSKTFGNYKVISEIGRGGMGAVFLAERIDGAFEQKVALKIIRNTIADSELEKRFRRERQILANLNHPNIARLLDGGVSENGEAFLVMEYIAGERLLTYAENKNLGIEERLRLFLKICRAVSYAHRNLIIHRDIKPSNILITNEGEPKLLDFGLAKILDENLTEEAQTVTAFRAFTPAYASPEQIRGHNVTTSTDIYSLGVLLYELLTGERPFRFENRNLEEILNSISNTEPVKPSAVSLSTTSGNSKSKIQNPKSLEGDLDNIVLMALRKEPEQRYATVDEFAKDVERHMNKLPVLARPQTFVYRASKFIARNKIAFAASAFVFIAIITGLAVTLWQANIVRKERDRAEKRFNDVRKLSNSLLFEITPEIERLEGSTKAREILVRRALEYLDSLANEAQNDLQLQTELASAYSKIGEIQGNPSKPSLGDYTGAAASYQKANSILKRLPQTLENKKLLAENFRQLAKVRQNDTKGSIGDSEEAIKIYENLFADNPSLTELKISSIETQSELAQIHSSNSDFKSALKVLSDALPQLEKLDTNNQRVQELYVTAMTQHAFALSWESRQAEAEAEMAKAVTNAETLAGKYPNDVRVQQVLWEAYFRASAIYETIKDDLSLEFAEKALKVKQKAAEADASDTQAKHNLARSYSRVGLALSDLKRTRKAIIAWEKAEKILLQLSERQPKNIGYHADLATLYYRIGDAEKLGGKFQDALATFQKALEKYEILLSADEKNLNALRHIGTTAKNIADLQLKLSDKENAKQNYQKAITILNRLKSEKALPEYDNKLIEEIKIVLEKL